MWHDDKEVEQGDLSLVLKLTRTAMEGVVRGGARRLFREIDEDNRGKLEDSVVGSALR